MIELSRHRKSFFFLVAGLVFTGTFLAIKFASGYKIDLSTFSFRPTGLLVATSTPDGAEVYVNGKLKSATNDTLSLAPDDYLIEIKKSGFIPWQKKVKIQKELVVKTDANLFFSVPDLKPLTFTHVENPQLSPDGTRIVFSVPPAPATPSATQNISADNEAGLWTIDLTDFLFGFGRSPKQIAKSQLPGMDFTKSQYSWSPDSRQILVEFDTTLGKEEYLLDPSQFNQASAMVNIANTLPQTMIKWQEEESLKKQTRLKRLPEKLQEILGDNTEGMVFSPDNTKILYTATASAEIPEGLISPVPAASSQKEERNLNPKGVYVYDVKEDRNFLLPVQPSSSPAWLNTSRHLFWIEEDKVVACEYDATNLITIYSGPFIKPHVFSAPGTNKLVILSQLNLEKDSRPNLYSVSLR